MWKTVALAVAGTGLAALPLLVSRRRSLLNPALLVFCVVAWSLLLETAYVALFRARRSPGHDMIYGRATSPDFLFAGALLVLVAVVGYVAGFLVRSGRISAVELPPGLGQSPAPRRSHVVVALLLLLAVASFVAYLVASDTSLFSGAFSGKRFKPADIGVFSRFLYGPYYLFKLAMASGPVAYAAALLLFRSQTRREERLDKLLFSLLFVFALMLSHYASLRLFIALLVLQVFLLVARLEGRRHLSFLCTFAALTFGSFAWITFVDRPPAVAPPIEVLPAPAAEKMALTREDAAPEPETAPLPAVASPSARPPDEPTPAAPPAAASETVLPPTAPQPGTAALPVDAAAPRLRRAAFARARPLLAAAFEGRYFLDVAKMAQIAHHFPRVAPFLLGESLLGRAPSAAPDAAATDGTFNRYLSRTVFGEPNNSIPSGYAGELYVNFGRLGVLVGFLLLGAFHRLVFDLLSRPDLPIVAAAGLVALIPSTTLVLLNTGLLAALSRAVFDLGVLLLVWYPSRRAWTLLLNPQGAVRGEIVS